MLRAHQDDKSPWVFRTGSASQTLEHIKIEYQLTIYNIMDNDFSKIMAGRSDSELYEILTKLKDDYQSEAVHAAEIEFKKRNLSTEQLASAKIEIEEKEDLVRIKENESLEAGQKLLFFIFFWGLIPWAMAGTFKSEGYLKKNKDAWRFMRYGFFSFLGILILLFLIGYLI